MKIIIGLGNPGKEYESTRHNVGFQVVDLIREKLEFENFVLKKKFDSLISEGTFNDEKVILIKPITFMNLSGKAVSKLIKYYKLDLENLLIIYDDLDFQIGTFKIKPKGGPGSHNGMKSIIASIGSENFSRIRIGIESREQKHKKMGSGKGFVLGKFTKEEEKLKDKVKDQASNASIDFINSEIVEVMNKYN